MNLFQKEAFLFFRSNAVERRVKYLLFTRVVMLDQMFESRLVIKERDHVALHVCGRRQPEELSLKIRNQFKHLAMLAQKELDRSASLGFGALRVDRNQRLLFVRHLRDEQGFEVAQEARGPCK